MPEKMPDIAAWVRRFAEQFDVRRLSVADLRRFIDLASSTIAILETLQAKAGARLAETDEWKREGYRSPAEQLARQTRTSVGQAKSAIDTGKRLSEHPDVEQAAVAGKLSFEQAAMVADAANSDPGSTRRLIAKAQNASFADLRDEVARTKADAVTDPEAHRRKIHDQRALREWISTDGVWQMRASGNKEDGAEIMAAIRPVADRLFDEARRQVRRESTDAYNFDALLQIAKDRTSSNDRKRPQASSPEPRSRGGAPVKLLVRIDYDVFLRGVRLPGETCELAGYGPVPASVVRELVANGDPFVAAILTKGKSLVGAAHLGRRPNSLQRSALEWLFPTCAVDGCRVSAHLEADHIEDWSKTHFTMLDLLDFKCRHHHRLKTVAGWDFVKGTRNFVPPDDPRHPRYRRRE
jgi:hypothetical protein